MSQLIVAIPVCHKDFDLVMRNLDRCIQLDTKTKCNAVVAYDSILGDEKGNEVAAKAKTYFNTVSSFRYEGYKGIPDWPRPQNYAWQSVARHFESLRSTLSSKGWLWWESDSLPLKPKWLDVLDEAFRKCRLPFFGHIVEGKGHMNGVAIYPLNISDYVTNAMLVKSSPFDVMLSSELRRSKKIARGNDFIGHRMKRRGGDAATDVDIDGIENLPPKMVLFHGLNLSNRIQSVPLKDNHFYTSGNLGDVIYSLPTIIACGGGKLFIGPTQTCAKKCREAIDERIFNNIAPLLRIQPCLSDVVYVPTIPESITHDLNQFRNYYVQDFDPNLNLATVMLRYFQQRDHECDRPWIRIDKPDFRFRVIVNRSARYHEIGFPWKKIVKKYNGNIGFVGTRAEHIDFCNRFGIVPYVETPTLLDLARVIGSSELFIGNQSSPYAIAEAIKHRTIQETCHNKPDCVFHRPNAVYMLGLLKPKDLPDLDLSTVKNNLESSAFAGSDSQVTVSIVCHNKLDLTKRCIQALFRFSTSFGLIITDNASVDGTKEFLKELVEKYPQIKVVSNSENLGFIKPNENAYRLCTSPFFVTLNNDYIVSGKWIEKMLSRMKQDSKLAIVGASGSCCSLSDAMEGYLGDRVEYVEASCMMVRRSVINNLQDGLFSPYVRFAYGEDSDLSLRVRESGHDIGLVDIESEHKRASTSSLVSERYYVKLQKVANHAALKHRWSPYIKRRNFEYEVLIKRKEARGDVLFVTPIVESLKFKWPQCNITVETDFPDIFDRNPNVKLAASSRFNDADFDYVFDLNLAYEWRPYLHAVTAYADVCGLIVKPNWSYHLYPSEKDYEFVSQHSGKIALIHAGPTTWPGKNWSIEKFNAVAAWLTQQGFSIYSVGLKDNKLVQNSFDFRGVSIGRYAALCKRAKLFVGLDSFPSHCAEAMGCQTVIICGALDASLRSMDCTRVVTAMVSDAACALELHRLPPPRIDAPCGGDCMRSISVERVLAEFNTLK